MLAATQLGLVPAEVKSQQDEAFALADAARAAWPPTKREYDSEDVRKISTAMNRSISKLIDALVNATADPLVADRDELVSRASDGIKELQRFQRALALPVEQSRKGATVDLPEFRAAVPAMMDRTARIWSSMNPTHDIFLGWMGGLEAEGISQGFSDIVDVVKEMPGATKPPGFLARHGRKIAAGVAVVGVGSVATWWFLRRGREFALQEHDLLAAELPPPPVGVHVLGPGDGEALSVKERTIITPAGDQILITGDIDDRKSVGKIAEILRSLPSD